MKKMKALLFPILFGMFLASCGGNTPAASKKASIKIETNQYMTTTLQEGEYELNKAVEFRVSSINEEYNITSVKMDNTELTPANDTNIYTFTPIEEKEYKLKVATIENEDIIVFTFDKLTPQKYREELTKKGVRLNIDNQDAGYDELIKNGFVFTRYLAQDYIEYPLETTFLKETSLAREEIDIEQLFQ